MTADTSLTHREQDALFLRLRAGETPADAGLLLMRLMLQYARLEGDLRAATAPLRKVQ